VGERSDGVHQRCNRQTVRHSGWLVRLRPKVMSQWTQLLSSETDTDAEMDSYGNFSLVPEKKRPGDRCPKWVVYI